MKKILIIGGGVAAYEAALAASAAPETTVTVCSAESVPPYRRPALSRMVAEEVADAAFYFKPAAFYAERGIDLRLDAEAEALDREKRELRLADGTILPWDALVLATGGYAFVPPLPGAEHIRVLRSYKDLLTIRELLKGGLRKAVIAGAGVLGLELADSLLKKGCEVTLLETGPAVLGRNLDEAGAGTVKKLLAQKEGLTVLTNVSAGKVFSDGVELTDGRRLDAGAVFFSTGVRRCARLAADAGLAVGRGIVIDDRTATSDPAVFACGDAAELNGRTFGLLNAAKTMGHIAGVNAAGGDERFVPESWPVRLNALGIKLFSAGTPAGARVEHSETEGAGKSLIYDDSGKLAGVVLLGDLSEAAALQKELAR